MHASIVWGHASSDDLTPAPGLPRPGGPSPGAGVRPGVQRRHGHDRPTCSSVPTRRVPDAKSRRRPSSVNQSSAPRRGQRAAGSCTRHGGTRRRLVLRCGLRYATPPEGRRAVRSRSSRRPAVADHPWCDGLPPALRSARLVTRRRDPSLVHAPGPRPPLRQRVVVPQPRGDVSPQGARVSKPAPARCARPTLRRVRFVREGHACPVASPSSSRPCWRLCRRSVPASRTAPSPSTSR